VPPAPNKRPPPAIRADRPPLRRPLIGALAAVVLGTWLGLRGPAIPWLTTTLAVSLLGLAWYFRQRRWAPILRWMALVGLTWSHAHLAAFDPAPHALHRLMQRPREHMVVRGTIQDDPVLESTDRQQAHWRFTLDLEAINRWGAFEQASGRMDVQGPLPSDITPPRYGDTWELAGIVQDRRAADWRWSHLPPYRLRVQAATDNQRLATGGGRWLKRLSFAGRRQAARLLGQGLDNHPTAAGILRALLLGYRHELPHEQHRLFALTGTLHIFAVSGLHVGIVGGLFTVLIRAFGISRRYWILWVGPLLIIYTIATGLRPSAVRACVMALTFGSAYLVNRRPDAPSAWALAAILILLATPTQLTNPGFIFSFVIVAGLIRLYPIFAPTMQNWAVPDPYRLPTHHKDHSVYWRVGQVILGLAAASLAAWLSSAPLNAHYFNLIAPVGLLGNLIVIPAAFLMVSIGVLALAAGTLWLPLAALLNQINAFILQVLIRLVEIMSDWPGSHFHVRAPGLFWMWWAYTLLFAGLCWRTRRTRRWGYGALGLMAVIGLAVPWVQQPARLHVLEAGDGLAVLIQARGFTALYDTGPAYRSERLLRDLRRQGVNRLDVLVLSQATAGHAGAAPDLLDAIPVGELWHTPYPSRSPAYNDALEIAADRGIPIRPLIAGMHGQWPGGWHWSVLHPADPSAYRRAADAALTMRIHRGTHSVLLTGGGDANLEALLLNDSQDLAASVWVVGHQGRGDTASADWLAAVAPTAIILPIDPFARYGYPDPDVWDRLTARPDTAVWRTDEAGPVTVQLTSHHWGGRQRDRLRVYAPSQQRNRLGMLYQ